MAYLVDPVTLFHLRDVRLAWCGLTDGYKHENGPNGPILVLLSVNERHRGDLRQKADYRLRTPGKPATASGDAPRNPIGRATTTRPPSQVQ